MFTTFSRKKNIEKNEVGLNTSFCRFDQILMLSFQKWCQNIPSGLPQQYDMIFHTENYKQRQTINANMSKKKNMHGGLHDKFEDEKLQKIISLAYTYPA